MKKTLFTLALLAFVGTSVTACSGNKGYVPPGGHQSSGSHGGGGHSH
mgnify:CR=1 FL=1